jgi:hypothetical protein
VYDNSLGKSRLVDLATTPQTFQPSASPFTRPSYRRLVVWVTAPALNADGLAQAGDDILLGAVVEQPLKSS